VVITQEVFLIKSIALLGYGVVGSGVVELLNRNRKDNSDKYNEDIFVKKILVRNLDKYREDKHFDLITDNIKDILDADIDIVVEVMGGLEPSYEYVQKFIQSGKHVVTANKDLIAEYGEHLHKLAKENQVQLKYEASVGGGIPILRPVKECLIGNTIDSIVGILNGTTNFILSKMYSDDMGYNDALKLAQRLGFAEANPESDVMGLDAARKLSIISSIAYHKNLSWRSVPTEGITNLDKQDIENAKCIDSKIKLLAMSSTHNKNVYATVRPALVRTDSQIAKIDNEFNGIRLHGDAVGEVMFTGKGAGKLPTASAVYGDILNIILNKENIYEFREKKSQPVKPFWPYKAKWLLRITCDDKKEILGTILRVFSNYPVELLNTESNDLLVVVEVGNEEVLNRKVSELKDSENIHNVKSIICLDENSL